MVQPERNGGSKARLVASFDVEYPWADLSKCSRPRLKRNCIAQRHKVHGISMDCTVPDQLLISTLAPLSARKAHLAGASAALRIPDPSPVFWFYFQNAGQGFGQSGLMASASRPEDYSLAKMEDHKNDRELVVGEAGMLGNSTGVPAGDIVAVSVQNVSPGIYKVTISRPLESGEYSFVPPGGAAAFGMAGGQLYDFGVDRPR